MAEFLFHVLTLLIVLFYVGLLCYIVGSFIDDAIRATVRSELHEHEERRERIARLDASSEKPAA